MKPWLLGVVLLPLVACEIGDPSPNPPNASADAGASIQSVDGGVSALDGAAPSAPRDAGGPAKDAGAAVDPLVTSFVFVGCNRVQKGDWDSTANPSSANVTQLQQTFSDVAAMPDLPKHFFFTGDMVLAMKSGTTDLSSQLDAWAALFHGGPIAKMDLLPMPGNHEMLYKDKSSGLELANVGADDVFTKWLTTQGFGAHAGNGPTNAKPNADALMDDQSKLSYSFDDGTVHFVVLNTDTWTSTQDPDTSDGALGWIALDWLLADLKAAQSNAAISSIFVLGHKPIVSPSGTAAGSEAIYPTLTTALVTALDQTPKVKGYFSAHAHLWDSRKLAGSRGVAQIIAGNGGSLLDSGGLLTGDTYGFTEARVYQSGKVGIVPWHRPVPVPYNATTTQTAVPAAELLIAQ